MLLAAEATSDTWRTSAAAPGAQGTGPEQGAWAGRSRLPNFPLCTRHQLSLWQRTCCAWHLRQYWDRLPGM